MDSGDNGKREVARGDADGRMGWTPWLVASQAVTLLLAAGLAATSDDPFLRPLWVVITAGSALLLGAQIAGSRHRPAARHKRRP